MSLIILRHQTVTLKDKVRAEDHWTIMNWSDLHLWEPEKVLWDLRPLDSLFSRIGQLVRLLSSRWPPSTNDSLFGRHLHSSDLLGRRWIMMGLPWRRPTTHHVASVSILRRWLSCYLVARQLRWSNSKKQIIFADLDQRGIQSWEFSSWISMQISKTLSTIMLKLGSETGSICRGWNKLLLENGDAHANLKRVETNAKEEAQQGGRGLNGKAVPP